MQHRKRTQTALGREFFLVGKKKSDVFFSFLRALIIAALMATCPLTTGDAHAYLYAVPKTTTYRMAADCPSERVVVTWSNVFSGTKIVATINSRPLSKDASESLTAAVAQINRRHLAPRGGFIECYQDADGRAAATLWLNRGGSRVGGELRITSERSELTIK